MDKATIEECIAVCERIKVDRGAMQAQRGHIELARESAFTASEISAALKALLT